MILLVQLLTICKIGWCWNVYFCLNNKQPSLQGPASSEGERSLHKIHTSLGLRLIHTHDKINSQFKFDSEIFRKCGCIVTQPTEANWLSDLIDLSEVLYYTTLQTTLQPIETLSTIKLNLCWSKCDEYINRPRWRRDCDTN